MKAYFLVFCSLLVSYVIFYHEGPARNISSSSDSYNDLDKFVKTADSFSNQFKRSHGWTGADGTYSVKIDNDKTLWFFSDTILGDVKENGSRELFKNVETNHFNLPFLHNSVAIQSKDLSFILEKNSIGKYKSNFEPPTHKGWFWVNSAFYNDKDREVNLFLNQFVESSEQRYLFGKQEDVWLANFKINNGEIVNLVYKKIDFQLSAKQRKKLDETETVFASATMNDGDYLYIYNSSIPIDSVGNQKYLSLARAPINDLSNENSWEYFDGAHWSNDVMNMKTLREIKVSNEYSVSKYKDFYIMTVHDQNIGAVTLRVGETPAGPWSEAIPVHFPIEKNISKNVYSYNSKGHIHLSNDEGFLISYNVNSYNADEAIYENADIYRPRFIRVEWSFIESIASKFLDKK